MKISFPNILDGVIEIVLPDRNAGGSSLVFPRKSPVEGFNNYLVKRCYRDDPDKIQQSNIKKNIGYFFRVRSKINEKGELVSALYGKFAADISVDGRGMIGFCYYLNPTPNDRNIEFDPKQNLFKGKEFRHNKFAP